MMTSLAVLTLEVYYRYMPLYRTDKPEEMLPAKETAGRRFRLAARRVDPR